MPLRISVFLLALMSGAAAQELPQSVTSPDGRVVARISTGRGGELTWDVQFQDKAVLAPSRLGLDPQGQPPLSANLRLASAQTRTLDETYSMPHGKANPLRNHCHSLTLAFEETTGLRRQLGLEVRAFNDGVALRYTMPQQPSLRELRLERELTQFQFAREGRTFPLILNGYSTSYEDSYVQLPLTSLKTDSLIALPLLVEVPGAAWVAVTEAHLENYAGLYLKRATGRTLEASLAPRIDDSTLAVRAATPLETPWRVLLIGDRPGALAESDLVLHLNPPSRIADTSWIRPGKTAWSWWSGDYATGVPFKPGMNTETMKHYIDFAAEAGLDYVLLDEGWSGDVGGRARDLTRTNPAIDLPGILDYAKSKNVGVWLWAYWTFVDTQMDEAFPLFEKWGVRGVKIDFMDRDDQQMVDFYHRTARKAAGHKLMIDWHGAYKPTGLRRYYPNVLTHEAAMSLEYVKWSNRVTAGHNTILPFTRGLAGPMDYTPGGFHNVAPEEFTPRFVNPTVPTTRAHQLALFVVFESAFTMLCDYPGAYRGQKELDFLKAVPVTWDETRVPMGEPGEFAITARRKGADWFIGGITNREAREIRLPLSFLGAGRYRAEIYTDGAKPAETVVQRLDVTASRTITLKLAPAGGFAAILRPAR